MRSALLQAAFAPAWILAAACGAPAEKPPASLQSADSPTVSIAAQSADAAAPSVASSRLASVARAVDGDTLLLSDGDRVRILGIDTPEMRDDSSILRSLAERAREALASDVDGRSVRLVPGPRERDTYGRLLARVEVEQAGSWIDVGERQLVSGLARVYPNDHDRLARYLVLEAEARARAAGVWAPEARRAWGPRAEIAIVPGEASEHLGKIARVEGRLVEVRRTPKVLALTLEGGGARLKVIAFGPALFPPDLVASWTNRDIAATGKLKLYQGLPELVIESPDQVEIPASETDVQRSR